MGVASTGVIGARAAARQAASSGARAACGGARRPTRTSFSRGHPHHRPLAQARLPRGGAAIRHRAAGGAGEGRRHDLAAATPRCSASCETDAALDAGDARPAHRRVREALVRPHLAWTASSPRATPCSCSRTAPRACASSRSRPDELALGEALDALMRQLALEIVADGEGAKRVGRVVVRGGAELVEPVARSVANSPLVKTALHGADPNFGRILQAAGQVWPPGAPFVVDLEIEGRQVVSAGDARPGRRASWRARAAVSGAGGRVRAHDPRRGRRDRGLLQRPLPRVRDHQRGVHDMRDVATLLEALPYIREFHGTDGRDQVRRRRHDRPG